MIVNGQALLEAAPIKDMQINKTRAHGVSQGLSEVGYDIRIKQEIMFDPAYGPHVFVDQKISEMTIGRFCLASSIEEFQMPTHLMGIVHDKSTWARRGLSVFNTVIEPGWKGFLTLELVFHGNEPVIIKAGSGIAQVVFHQLALPATYEGKYQNQADEPVSAILA